MAIDRDSDEIKHIITGHEHWVQRENGRGSLRAYTFCRWLYVDGRMEGAYVYGDWWRNPSIEHVCPLCVHVAECEKGDPEVCAGCAEVEKDTALSHPLFRENKKK